MERLGISVSEEKLKRELKRMEQMGTKMKCRTKSRLSTVTDSVNVCLTVV